MVVGRIITVLLGPTTRLYEPQLRFFELINSETQERLRVDLQSRDGWFVLPLPAGDYELTRIQIAEGAFLGMAVLQPRFRVTDDLVTYVGTWRLGVESPQNERSILLSAVEESENGIREALARYPDLKARGLTTSLLTPSTVETRLYEVPPYPRFWWFRRHPTT